MRSHRPCGRSSPSRPAVLPDNFRKAQVNQPPMRLLLGICLTVAVATASEKPGRDKTKRPAMPTAGIKTPGVQIPFASLKAEAELPAPAQPDWIFFSESVIVPNKLKDSVERIDTKTNKPADPIASLKNPCAGMASGFGSLWVPTCGDGALARL